MFAFCYARRRARDLESEHRDLQRQLDYERRYRHADDSQRRTMDILGVR